MLQVVVMLLFTCNFSFLNFEVTSKVILILNYLLLKIRNHN